MSLPIFITISRSQIAGYGEFAKFSGRLMAEFERSTQLPLLSKTELAIFAIQHPIVVTPRHPTIRKGKKNNEYLLVSGLNTLMLWDKQNLEKDISINLPALLLVRPTDDELICHAQAEGFISWFAFQLTKTDFAHLYQQYARLPEQLKVADNGAFTEIFSSQRSFAEHAKMTRQTLLTKKTQVEKYTDNGAALKTTPSMTVAVLEAMQSVIADVGSSS